MTKFLRVSNSVTWKLNFETQSCKSKLQPTKGNIVKQPKIKIYPNQQSISRTRHSDSRETSYMFSQMLWKGVPILVRVPIYLSLVILKYLFPHFLSNRWLFVYLITTMKSLTISQKPTRPTNHLQMCLV